MDFKKKYLKYKTKYLLSGGTNIPEEFNYITHTDHISRRLGLNKKEKKSCNVHFKTTTGILLFTSNDDTTCEKVKNINIGDSLPSDISEFNQKWFINEFYILLLTIKDKYKDLHTQFLKKNSDLSGNDTAILLDIKLKTKELFQKLDTFINHLLLKLNINNHKNIDDESEERNALFGFLIQALRYFTSDEIKSIINNYIKNLLKFRKNTDDEVIVEIFEFDFYQMVDKICREYITLPKNPYNGLKLNKKKQKQETERVREIEELEQEKNKQKMLDDQKKEQRIQGLVELQKKDTNDGLKLNKQKQNTTISQKDNNITITLVSPSGVLQTLTIIKDNIDEQTLKQTILDNIPSKEPQQYFKIVNGTSVIYNSMYKYTPLPEFNSFFDELQPGSSVELTIVFFSFDVQIDDELKKELRIELKKKVSDIDLDKYKNNKNKKEIMMYLMKRKPLLLQKLSEILRKDKDVVFIAVSNDGLALNHAENFKDDKDVVIAAVKKNGCALMDASDNLKNDKEVVLEAFKTCDHAVLYISPEFKQNEEVILAAVKNHGRAFQYVPKIFKDKKKIVLAALKTHSDAFLFVSERLKKDPEVILAVIDRNEYALKDAPPELKANKETVIKAVKKFGKALFYASKELQEDEDVVKYAVSQDDILFQKVSENMRGNKIVVLNAIHKNWENFQYASEEMKANIDVATVAINTNVSNLKYVPNILKENEDFVKKIFQKISWFSPIKDKTFALTLMKLKPSYINKLSTDLQNDEDIKKLLSAKQKEDNI